jgi:hypothetical protein
MNNKFGCRNTHTANQRFERTVASELAVPASLRATAASQAQRYAS